MNIDRTQDLRLRKEALKSKIRHLFREGRERMVMVSNAAEIRELSARIRRIEKEITRLEAE